MADSSEPDSYVLELAQVISENEEAILSLRDELESALYEQFREGEETITRDDVEMALKEVFDRSLSDEERSQRLSRTIFAFLVVSDSGTITQMKKANIKGELLDFLGGIQIRYQHAAQNLYLATRQGEYAWKNTETDFVIRSPEDVAGLNHKITRADDQKFELQNSVRSNISMINVFLKSQVDAIEVFGKAALEQIPAEELKTTERLIGEIISKAENNTPDEKEDE